MPESAPQTASDSDSDSDSGVSDRSRNADRAARRRMYGPPRSFELTFLSPTPALAYAVPVVLAAIVAAIVGLSIVERRTTVIVNGDVAQLGSSTSALAAAAIAIVLLCAGHAFGITAATHSLVANALESSLSARAAWRAAARRPGPALVAFVGALVLVGAGVAASIAFISSPLVAVAGMLVALVLLIVAAPLLLAWPPIVTGRVSWGSALARAWRSGRDVVSGRAEYRTPRVSLFLVALVTGVVGIGLRLLVASMNQSLIAVMLDLAVSFVVPAVTVLMLTVVAVRAAAVRADSRPGGVYAPEPAHPTPAGETREPDAGTRGGALVGLAVLLVPALLAAPLVLVNPWGFVSYSAAATPRVWDSASVMPVGDRMAVLSATPGWNTALALCDGAKCSPPLEPSSILSTAAVSTADGGLVTAQWRPVEAEGLTPDRFELDVVSTSPDELADWEGTVNPDDLPYPSPPGTRTTVAGIDVFFDSGDSVFTRSNSDLSAVAVSNEGEHPVVAGVVRNTAGPPDATLSTIFCDDDACTSSTTKSVPLTWAGGHPSSASIDVAVTDDGTAVVTLADRGTSLTDEPVPALRVISTTADGRESRVEALGLADVVAPDPSEIGAMDYDTTFGAQVELGADGLPVILSRPEDSTALRLFSCDDVACSTTRTTDLAVESGARTPAFTIDGSGRPLIALVDNRRESLDLVTCLDALCADTTTRMIAELYDDRRDRSTEGLALSLDASDRPIIAVGSRRAGDVDAKQTWSGTVLGCAAARCGLD